MKFFLLFFSLLVVPYVCFCQSKQLLGEVKSSSTSQSLPYVNIGISNKTVGTVSNDKGEFRLDLNEKVNTGDTVIFSYIGFKTEKYLVSDLSEQKKIIFLKPQSTQLDEVVLNAKKVKLRSKKIGRSSKGLGLMHSNFYSYYEKDVDDRLSKERGMKFRIRNTCYIQDLNFNITSNDFESLKFRVNIYKVENGLPTDLIIHQNIIFEIKDNYLGWFKFDLKPYDIYIKDGIEEIAVTIQ